MPAKEFAQMEKTAKNQILLFKILALAFVLIMAVVSFSSMISEKPDVTNTDVNSEIVDGIWTHNLKFEFNVEMSSVTVEIYSKSITGNDYYGNFSLDKKYDDENPNLMYLTLETDEEIDENSWGYSIVSMTSQEQMGNIVIFITTLLPISIIATLIFVGTLTMGVKTYWYGDNHVMVYGGCVRHQLIINGLCVKKHNSVLPFGYKDLVCFHEGNTYVVSVTKTNKIKLFVNGIPQEPISVKKDKEPIVDTEI